MEVSALPFFEIQANEIQLLLTLAMLCYLNMLTAGGWSQSYCSSLFGSRKLLCLHKT